MEKRPDYLDDDDDFDRVLEEERRKRRAEQARRGTRRPGATVGRDAPAPNSLIRKDDAYTACGANRAICAVPNRRSWRCAGACRTRDSG